MNSSTRGLAIAALATLVACGHEVVLVCTEIGCDDGLAVSISGTLPDSYTVSLIVDGRVEQVIDCVSDQNCIGGVFFSGTTPGRATIEITMGESRVQKEVIPVYSIVRPNGNECPPTCRQGKAAVELD